MFTWRRFHFVLIVLSLLVCAESSILGIREELGNYAKDLNDFGREILQQIDEKNEDDFSEEGIELCESAGVCQLYLIFLTDLIDIHLAGQKTHPKKLYLVDTIIQTSKNRIAEYLAIEIEFIDNDLSTMEDPYLVTRGVELKNTTEAVKAIVDSLDFMSIYK